MNKNVLLSFFLVLSYFAFGQVKFHEMNLGSKYSEQELTEAVENANWCGYYHESKNYELHFDDGAIVKLKNKAQLLSNLNNSPMTDRCFQNISAKSENIHFINSSGWIMVPKEKIVSKSNLN